MTRPIAPRPPGLTMLFLAFSVSACGGGDPEEDTCWCRQEVPEGTVDLACGGTVCLSGVGYLCDTDGEVVSEPGLCECVPNTCEGAAAECGTISDGCHGTVTCGDCPEGLHCGGGGVANRCGEEPCTTTTCSAENAECDTISDGCGDILDCGACPSPGVCGASGTPNQCGCAPTSCEAQDADCGVLPDGCGGTLDCGDCEGDLVCGGDGANRCGDEPCTPTTCAAEGADCGIISNGCGATMDCGSCESPDTCGGGDVANQCGCQATTCDALGVECGETGDGCGGNLPCGNCEDVPNGTNECVSGSCQTECNPGFHACSGACVADADPEHCGSSCVPCPDTENGTAHCSEELECSLVCDSGFEECADACVPCPSGAGVVGTTCVGESCVATACAPGYVFCEDGCCGASPVSQAPDGPVDAPMDGFSCLSIQLDSDGSPHVIYRGDYDTGARSSLFYAWSADEHWTITTVAHMEASSDSARRAASLALDATDAPIIAFYDEALSALRLATWDGDGFVVDTVDDHDINRYSTVDLAIDPLGNPHLAYSAEGSHSYALRFASRTGSTWSVTTVDDTRSAGAHASLALDSASRPHIAYYDLTNSDLRYATFDGVEWQLQTLDGEDEVGTYTSIGLDSSDAPHISYWDESNQGLKYAHRTSSGWSIEPLDATAAAGGYTALALDSMDRPHIGYYTRAEYGDGVLRYAYWSGTTWVAGVAISGYERSTGVLLALALDDDDLPHVAHLHYRGFLTADMVEVRYAHQDEAGTWWDDSSIESYADVGRHVNMVLDRFGYPHLVYNDDGDTDTWTHGGGSTNYTHWNGSAWIIEHIPGSYSAGSVGMALDRDGEPHVVRSSGATYGDDAVEYYHRSDGRWVEEQAVDLEDGSRSVSVALDVLGQPHVVFVDRGDNELSYLARVDGTWSLPEPIGEVGEYGGDAALRLTSDQRPLVAFRHDPNGLSFASRGLDGTWHLETVDSGSSLGANASMVLDGEDLPHVAYADLAEDDVKYAVMGPDGSWTVQFVDTLDEVGAGISLALDASGMPHITYRDATTGAARHAQLDGVWEFADLGEMSYRGSTALQLDLDGAPHVVFLNSDGHLFWTSGL